MSSRFARRVPEILRKATIVVALTQMLRLPWVLVLKAQEVVPPQFRASRRRIFVLFLITLAAPAGIVPVYAESLPVAAAKVQSAEPEAPKLETGNLEPWNFEAGNLRSLHFANGARGAFGMVEALSAMGEANAPPRVNTNFSSGDSVTNGPGAPEKNGSSNREYSIEGASEYPYNWRGLLLQSLSFNVIENGVRVASDHNMRDQLAHKPFWHDYINSLQHFDMYRWNDGDDFLVNYVGHTMQGAVGAQIAIQNSPVGSRIRWGDPGYLLSRFKGFLWTTVYSTHSEISPIGEAGIGNEGGFTYGNQCLAKCNSTNFRPGVSKYTNNTGWVDFIVTPTAGMVWVVAEDVIDKKLSDRIAARLPNHPLAARIIRAGLNPGRSWSNLLRGKLPWYRDYEHPWSESQPGAVHFLKSDEQIAWEKTLPRFEISPQISMFAIGVNTMSCTGCKRTLTSSSLEISARLLPWLDADGQVGLYPGASPLPSDRAGGSMTAAFFGVRSGVETKNYALHVSLRPGLVHFSHADETSPETTIIYPKYPGTTVGALLGTTTINPPSALGGITHFAWNVNVSGDYKITRALALRVGLGETVVRYRTNFVDPPGNGEPPYISYLSRENFMNRGSWSWQTGPVFSF